MKKSRVYRPLAVVVACAGSAWGEEWTAIARVPVPLSEASCVALDGLLYGFGGMLNSGPTNWSYVYNPKTDVWGQVAAMPAVRYSMNGAHETNGRIYVAGGFSAPNVAQSQLWSFDPRTGPTGTWATLAPHPIPFAWGGGGLINGRLYFSTSHNAGGGFQNLTSEYDLRNGAWTPRASSLTAHAGGVYTSLRGNFYAIGGRNSAGTTIGTGERYDPTTNVWSAIAPMPGVRRDAAYSVWNGDLVVAGGSDGTNDLDTVIRYNPVTNAWSNMPSLPQPRRLAAGAVVNGEFFVVGGMRGTKRLDEAHVFGRPCSANCDGSTTAPVLNVNDFICFTNEFASGCKQTR